MIKSFLKIIFFILISFSVNAEDKILRIGKDSAKVTVKVFSSLTCPHCASFHKNVFEDLKKEYIDKDYNQNGVKELFIDAGYRLGNTWTEKYYFFEYDLNTITLKKSLLADDWKKRLGVSDHHKSKFKNYFSESIESLKKRSINLFL